MTTPVLTRSVSSVGLHLLYTANWIAGLKPGSAGDLLELLTVFCWMGCGVILRQKIQSRKR